MKYEDISDTISTLINKSLNLRKIPFTDKYICVILNDNYHSELDRVCTELAAKIRRAMQEDDRGLGLEIYRLNDISDMQKERIEALEKKLEDSILKNVEYLEIIDRITSIKKPD